MPPCLCLTAVLLSCCVLPLSWRCRERLMKNHSVLEVDLVHVREYNQELGDALENRPAEFLPLVSRRDWGSRRHSTSRQQCEQAASSRQEQASVVAL